MFATNRGSSSSIRARLAPIFFRKVILPRRYNNTAATSNSTAKNLDTNATGTANTATVPARTRFSATNCSGVCVISPVRRSASSCARR